MAGQHHVAAAPHFGNVARDRHRVVDFAVAPDDRRDRHVPSARRALGAGAVGVEVGRLAAHSACHRRGHLCARIFWPQVRPQVAVHCREGVDLHRALAIAVHRLQTAFIAHDLDVVRAFLEGLIQVDHAVVDRFFTGVGWDGRIHSCCYRKGPRRRCARLRRQ